MPARPLIVRIALVGLMLTAFRAYGQEAPKNAALQSPAITYDSGAAATDSTAAMRQFVQGFYDWYTPIALADNHFPADWRVLSSAPSYLDAGLASALRADSVASLIVPDQRETLNFDPFLASQDPCPRYEVTDVRSAPRGYRVRVRPICADPRWQTATPVVVVIPDAGHWKIANVFYENDDLRSMLCQFAKGDRRPDKRPSTCQ
ncbi:MAG TPA: hypothetical protein VII52_16135 [Gemmatimonadaceae bacterium]